MSDSDKKDFRYLNFEASTVRRFRRMKPSDSTNTQFLRDLLKTYKGAKKK